MIVNDLKYRVSFNNDLSKLIAFSLLLSLILLSFSVRANKDIYKNAGFYKTTVGSYVVTAVFDGITTINEENLIIPNNEITPFLRGNPLSRFPFALALT